METPTAVLYKPRDNALRRHPQQRNHRTMLHSRYHERRRDHVLIAAVDADGVALQPFGSEADVLVKGDRIHVLLAHGQLDAREADGKRGVHRPSNESTTNSAAAMSWQQTYAEGAAMGVITRQARVLRQTRGGNGAVGATQVAQLPQGSILEDGCSRVPPRARDPQVPSTCPSEPGGRAMT